jgi:hypothetical protein
VALLRGLGTTVLVMALGAILAMVADFAWALPLSLRWAIWGSWLAAGVATLSLTLIRTIAPAISAFDLAALAERSRADLFECLTGGVALLEGGTSAHGSQELIAALAEQAAGQAETVDLSAAVSWTRARGRLTAGTLAVALVAVPALIWPHSFGALARRYLMPWADLNPIGRYLLTVAPGDRMVLIGSDVTFSVLVRALSGGGTLPEDAWLEWSSPGESTTHRTAIPPALQAKRGADSGDLAASEVPPGRRGFSLTLPIVSRSMSYRVRCGSAVSRRYQITAVEPPAVATFTASVEPPAYTKRPPKLVRDPNQIEAFEGSKVTLHVTANRPLRSLEVEWPDASGKLSGPIAAVMLSDGASARSFHFAEASGPFTLMLRDEFGNASRPEPARRLVVKPDAPPTILLQETEGIDDASPDDILGFGVRARDDIAVSSVELHYAIRRAGPSAPKTETGQAAISLRGLGLRRADGAVTFGLAPLGLKPGDTLSYRVRAADNRPAPRGPNVVWSPVRTLAIVAGVESVATRQSQARRTALQARLRAIKRTATRNREETDRLERDAESERNGSFKWDKAHQDALKEREAGAGEVSDRLQLLARDFADDPLARQLARATSQISEIEAEAAHAALDRARRAPVPSTRLAELRDASSRLAALSDRLENLERSLDSLKPEATPGQRLRALAERQEQIAGDAATALDRATFDRIQARQNSLGHDLDDLMKVSPELRAPLLAVSARDAERLARKARALAQSQREESRQEADSARHALSPELLADAQRALEDDARRLALDVDQPLADNGRARLNSEEIHRAVEAIVQGDIEQARQRLEGAENELRRLARDIEDVPSDPKALAGRLARRQSALNHEIDAAIREVRANGNLDTDEKAALASRLMLLARRQEAIAKLTETIQPTGGKVSRSRFPSEAARAAVQNTARASAAWGSKDSRLVDQAKSAAQHALERLANELPDLWKRQEPIRQKFDEARRVSGEVATEVARELRETDPRPDRPSTTAQAAVELAGRLQGTLQKQSRVVAALVEMEPDPRVAPQRDRAARRAGKLAEVLKDLQDPSMREDARSILAGVELAARASMDRLELKLNGRAPADDLVLELAEDQDAVRRAVEEDKEDGGPAVRDRAAAAQRRIAIALRSLNLPDLPLDSAEAVRLAEEAAHRLAGPRNKADDRAALGAAAAAVQALASWLVDRLAPRDVAAELARAQRGLQGAAAAADPVQAAARQRAIAAELARLPLAGKDEATARVARAVELTDLLLQPDQAQRADGEEEISALAAARARAADALAALASSAPAPKAAPEPGASQPPPAPADPELGLTLAHAAAARDLVRRQRQIREQQLSIPGRRLLPQQALRRQAESLAHDLSVLRERVRRLTEVGQYHAREAVQHLSVHAPHFMNQASEQLAQGRIREVRDAQRRSAELLERGAQFADDFAFALDAELRASRGMPLARSGDKPESASPGALGAAREAMSRAARALDWGRGAGQTETAVRAGAQAMREAARELRAASQASDEAREVATAGELRAAEPSTLDPQAEPSGTQAPGPELDSESGLAGKAAPDQSALKEVIRTNPRRAWGELPGHLRTEILQTVRGRYRDDYARLIQLYFREIAAGATPDEKAE